MPLRENEVIMFFLTLGVLLFLLENRKKLSLLDSGAILVTGFCIYFFGVVCTNLEGMFWPDLFNILEHLSYGLFGLFVAIWALRVFRLKKKPL